MQHRLQTLRVIYFSYPLYGFFLIYLFSMCNTGPSSFAVIILNHNQSHLLHFT